MNKKTVGEVILQWRSDAEKTELIKQLYYDEDVWSASQRFFRSNEFSEVLSIAKKHGKSQGYVLDIGGGNGVAALAWNQAGYQVTMLEPDSSEVVGYNALYPVLNSRNINTIHVYEGIAEKTSIADNSFDIVYCRQVLHHIQNLTDLAQEIRRLLKPNGVFIATREHVITSHEDLDAFWESHTLHHFTGGEYAYLESEYIEALESNFSDVKVLRYYDNIINYYPMTNEQFEELIQKELCRFGIFYHLNLCSILARFSIFQNWIATILNKKNQFPGRMYSFIASMPHPHI